MAEIVNLRQAKKRRARAAAEAKAAANRASHGRTPAQIQADHREGALRDRTLDGARLDEPAGDNAAKED